MDKKKKNEFYEIACTELETGQTKKGTWARAYFESEGDEEKAKVRYIGLRVDDLRHEEAKRIQIQRVQEEARINEKEWEELKARVEEAIGDKLITLITATGEEWVAAMGEKLLAVTNMAMSGDDLFLAFDDGTVLDVKATLMWAANDNGSDIDCYDATIYCDKYQGSGYTNWRISKLDELADLYGKMNRKWIDEEGSLVFLLKLIRLSSAMVWAYDTIDDASSYFNFENGERQLKLPIDRSAMRVIPARSIAKS
ncbi:MAG: hypothetical protein M0Q23_06730 [Syntrophales bacterium]|nr:hypothetical protein [Syntrophales bacterium]MCK9528321.1 hypothetical protein [Syntrophales bacterium]MDX9922160.1 hypothetical protein [Syntrophales bacterium]